MKNNISPKTKYRVKSLFDDVSPINDILVSYYLPIINPNSFSLYQFLMCETKNNTLNSIFTSIERITDTLNLSFDLLIKTIEKLELVNLVDILADKEGKIIFCLKKPLSPKEFNDSPQMKELLLSKVGNQNIEINNNMFNSMKNLSVENFESVTNEIELNIKMGNNIKTKLNVNFDFDSIKSIITAKGIDWSLFWDVNLEGKLIDVIVIHDVSVVDLSMEIIEEFQTNNFNINRLIKKIINSYSKKAIIDDFVNLEGNKLNFLESMTVSQYFTNKLERDPSTTELKLITKLKEKYGFGDYKINILIDYSIIVNNGAINKNYILKISDTIINEGMNTPQELIKHLKVSYKMKKNGNTKKLINSKIEMKDKPIF